MSEARLIASIAIPSSHTSFPFLLLLQAARYGRGSMDGSIKSEQPHLGGTVKNEDESPCDLNQWFPVLQARGLARRAIDGH